MSLILSEINERKTVLNSIKETHFIFYQFHIIRKIDKALYMRYR